MQDTIKKNLIEIQEEIAPYQPNIIAVTKYFDENAIIAAYQAGLRHFAESRAVEAVEKINKLPDEIRRNSKFHFIGHLQSNKVKKVVQNFDFIHSIDSVKIAQAVSEEALRQNKRQKVFLEINNSGEEQKFGFSKDELQNRFEFLKNLCGIEINGLMNMTPLGAEEEVLRRLFTEVKEFQDKLNQKFDCNMGEISMGMSQDYKIAAQCGSTTLRIGRKLFNQ